MLISSFEDFQSLYLDIQYSGGKEANAPCCFCPADSSTRYNKDGISFTGTRRVFFQPHNIKHGITCRECTAAGRGDRGTGWYSIASVMKRLGAEISDDIETKEYVKQEIYNLWSDQQVEEAHKKVDYEYWFEKCRWTREIVDEFKLGFGDIKVAYIGPAHLIPMKPQKPNEDPTQGWYLKARVQGKRPVNGLGSNENYFWFVETNPSTQTVVITESEKNVITARALGYENAIATYGTANVKKGMITWLWSIGYRHIIVMGDTGHSGEEFNERVSKWATWSKFETVRELAWSLSTIEQDNYDITDFFREQEGDRKAVRAILDSWLVDSKYVDVKAAPVIIIPREEIRGDGPHGIKGTITSFYETYVPKTMLILAPPPGAGKTHALVKAAEERARPYIEQRKKDLDELETQRLSIIEQLEGVSDATEKEEHRKALIAIDNRIKNFSYTAIAWYGQYINQWKDLLDLGADTSLWFNYEARNEDNCENHTVVNELGSKNHDIGRFCQTACPFKEACMQSGYLSQEGKRKQFPITFFRHPNMFMSNIREYPLGVIVDESPTAQWESSNVLTIKPSELYPHAQPADFEDTDEFEKLNLLMEATRAAMSTNAGAHPKDENSQIRGVQFLKLIDKQLSLHGTTLPLLLDGISDDTLGYYQPNYINGDIIKQRCVVELVQRIKTDLPHFIENPNTPNNVASRIKLDCGELILYMTPRIPLPARIPLIVADGTAMPAVLQVMFDRTPIVYRPEMRNENAQTIVIRGSNWTKGDLNRQIGNKVVRAKQKMDRLIAKADPDNPIFLKDLPIGGDFFDSTYVQETVELIQGLTEKHQKLFVIVYKDLRMILDGLLFEYDPSLKDKVSVGHYGSLRGTNQFQEWPAALLVGAYRIPYRVLMDMAMMWIDAMGQDRNPIDDAMIQKEEQHDTVEGLAPVWDEYRTYAHPFLDSFVQNKEKSEMIQSVERIRPHASDEKKFVYIAASRPVAKAITQIETKADFMSRMRPSKRKALYTELVRIGQRTLAEEGRVKFPPFRELAKNFGVSNDDIKKVKQWIKQERIFPESDEK